MIWGFFQLPLRWDRRFSPSSPADSPHRDIHPQSRAEEGLRRLALPAMKSAVVLVLGPLHRCRVDDGPPLAQCVDLSPEPPPQSRRSAPCPRELSVLMAGLLVTSLATGIVAADPPRPGTEGTGSPRMSRRRCGRDATATSARRVPPALRREPSLSIRSPTGRTVLRSNWPPATRGDVTRNDFEDLDAGGPDTSVHPRTRTLEDSLHRRCSATILPQALYPGAPGSGGPHSTSRPMDDARVR